MKKKGFATSAILYTMLLLFLVLMVQILNNLQNKKTILDQLKIETIEAIEARGNVCSVLQEELTSLKSQGDATSEDIIEGKTAIVQGELVIGTLKNNKKKTTYGIMRSVTDSSSKWARIENSVGLVANAQVGTTFVQNDFDSIYPWSDIKSYNYDTDTKTITAWYGDDNFTFTPDGNVEVLTYIPEFYYKREQKDGYEYVYISKENQEGYTKSDSFSIGRYTISGDTTRVHSKSGYQPLTRNAISTYRTLANNLGSEFSLLDYHYFIIQLLYLVEYADYDSQAKLGPGVTNGASVASGGCDILGMHSGSVNGSATTSVIYRGIEDIFGNIYQYVDGINISGTQVYVCYDHTKYVENKYDECYKAINYNVAGSTGGISKLGYDTNNPLISFPTETSSLNSITDIFTLVAGKDVAMLSGYNKGSTGAGMWNWYFDAYSPSGGGHIGARLLRWN